jgi:diguanylate cyclase (GGDEF)-like protein
MPSQVVTHRDAIRYAAGRVAITTALTALVTAIAVVCDLGADPDRMVPVGAVTVKAIMVAVIVSTLLSAALSFRSALLMKQLTRTRGELLQVSRTDQLTGLLNRRGFDAAAGEMLRQACAADVEVVALMCDIDRFKSINDQFGHDFGDRVLVEIGGVLQRFAASNDIVVARHGGEEFSALLVGVGGDQAIRTAEALCDRCAIVVEHNGVSARITVSIGVASHRGDADLPGIMRRADQALYLAKDRGRNRAVQVAPVSAAA